MVAIPIPVAVSTRGELVGLSIGNVQVAMPFDVALQVAAAMTVESRIAKKTSGDSNMRFRARGLLHDANESRPKERRFLESRFSLLRSQDIAVRHRGETVELRIGKRTAGFGYRAAIEIAQWLRLRGRQAKQVAGEGAHWSQIGRLKQFEAEAL